MNDITDYFNVFVDAVLEKYKDKKRWISHDDWDRLKDSDPYILYCFQL